MIRKSRSSLTVQGEFEKAVDGSKRPLIRILDWFHIAMKFRTIEQSAQKFPDLLAPNGIPVKEEIASAKWPAWHGKGSKAVERLKRIHDMSDSYRKSRRTWRCGGIFVGRIDTWNPIANT